MDFITDPSYDKLPDYRSEQEVHMYDEPKYDSAFPGDNLTKYKEWRAMWALRHFLEAADNSDDLHVVELPYHPLFPKAFVKLLCGVHKGKKAMPLHAVETFLEKHYGATLQRPDCDYLSDILQDKQYRVHSSQNVERALQWVEAKKAQLPLWPPQFIQPEPDLKQKADESLIKADELHNTSNHSYTLQQDITFLVPDFGWAQVDEVAQCIELIDNGKYNLKEHDKASITGLIDALIEYHIIPPRTIGKCNRILGERYGISVKTDRNRNIRDVFYQKALNELTSRGFKP